jgi:hypothetical protein
MVNEDTTSTDPEPCPLQTVIYETITTFAVVTLLVRLAADDLSVRAEMLPDPFTLLLRSSLDLGVNSSEDDRLWVKLEETFPQLHSVWEHGHVVIEITNTVHDLYVVFRIGFLWIEEYTELREVVPVEVAENSV